MSVTIHAATIATSDAARPATVECIDGAWQTSVSLYLRALDQPYTVVYPLNSATCEAEAVTQARDVLWSNGHLDRLTDEPVPDDLVAALIAAMERADQVAAGTYDGPEIGDYEWTDRWEEAAELLCPTALASDDPYEPWLLLPDGRALVRDLDGGPWALGTIPGDDDTGPAVNAQRESVNAGSIGT